MKRIVASLSAITLLIIVAGFYPVKYQTGLTGAWNTKRGSVNHVLIFQDGYFSYSTYDKAKKKFVRTLGGRYSISGGQMHADIEFDSEIKENVGGHIHFAPVVSGNSLKFDVGGGINSWTRIDAGNANLAGNWRLSGRMKNDSIEPIEKSARKTLKILTSTRFQWMEMNTETKEFLGTGGGTYTFKDGKYTENIEFFSRDSSRVGRSLSFDGNVNNNVWTHKGLSSRGEPIHEEWRREK